MGPGRTVQRVSTIDAEVNNVNAVHISLVSFTFCSLFSPTLLVEGDMVVGDKNCAAFIPCPGLTPRDAHSSQPQIPEEVCHASGSGSGTVIARPFPTKLIFGSVCFLPC